MSKSLGNFFTVRDLLDQGVPGEVIRFVMLSTHYRKPMDWTEKKRAEAEATLQYWLDLTWHLDPTPEAEFEPEEPFLRALADDLNTHLAFVVTKALHHQPQKLLDHARFLGFLSDETINSHKEYKQKMQGGLGRGTTQELSWLAAELDTMRNKAKTSKDFSDVDALKAKLNAMDIEVRVEKTGVKLIAAPDFDPSKLESLK